MNGASVELPVAIASLFTTGNLIIHIGDVAAHERAPRSWLTRSIERFAFSRARHVVTGAPLRRPEIMPFEEYPNEKFAEYEASWQAHIRTIEDIFLHAKS
jgi:hypothetical protein